jgi:hypothetical protein
MPYLVSFCNLGAQCSRYALGLAEFDPTRFSWVNIDNFIDPQKDHGITGVCVFEEGVLVCTQSSEPRIGWFDPDLRLRQSFPLTEARDLHSMAVRGHEVLIASSARNRLMALDLKTGAERCVFTARDADEDVVHLNGVVVRDGHALVSMFGEATDAGPRQGCVVDAETGQVVAEAICEPHSPVVSGGDLYVLGSAESKLYRFGQGETETRMLDGYLRGLSVTSDAVLVGRSGWRPARRLLGGLRAPPQPHTDPHGNPWQRSALIRIHRSSQVVESIDMSFFGPEIYDVVELPGAPAAERLFGDAAHRRLDALQEAQVRLSQRQAHARPARGGPGGQPAGLAGSAATPAPVTAGKKV